MDATENTNTNKYNLAHFNKAFEEATKQRLEKNKIFEEEILNELNKEKKDYNPFNKTLGNNIFSIKDALFEILDDLLQFQFNINTFTKERRLFYLGLLLILSVIIISLIDQFKKESIPEFPEMPGLLQNKLNPV